MATQFIQPEVKMKAANSKVINYSFVCTKIALVVITYFAFIGAFIGMGAIA